VLALRYRSNDLFAGGAAAVANHVASFAGHVQLVTVLGESDSHEDFIKSKLQPNVTPCFTVQPGAPTLIKRRFLDGYTFNKLLEVYIMDNTGLPEDMDAEFCRWVKESLPQYDLVIAADFGHGAISDRMVLILSEKALFLAVNTQANAGNRGFHTISRYPRADYVCLAEHEIRLDKRKMTGNLEPMMDELAEKLSCRTIMVTRGRSGSLARGRNDTFVASPSLAVEVVDRVGAGDAFFSVTALAAAQGLEEELIGFIGNVVGGLAVGAVGNQKPIDKLTVKKYVTSLLK
jgi:bifunctional ADP-heptose synthase (sugar kinase/adenylyltransferase)